MKQDDEKLAWQLLHTLFELGRADIPATPELLAARLGAPVARVRSLLHRLNAQRLVDEMRCRLTMKGLVLAVSMDGAQKLSRHLAAA